MNSFHFRYQSRPTDVTIKLEDWRRIARYLLPTWRPSLQLIFCIVAIAVLIVVPGLMMREMLDKAVPERNL